MKTTRHLRKGLVALLLAASISAHATSPSPWAYPSPDRPDTAAEAANMQTVRNLLDAFYVKKDINVAVRYLGPEYIQHAVDVADGKAGLASAIKEFSREFPNVQYEVKRIFAEGDMVTVLEHVRTTPGSLGSAYFHVYRLSDGKIVEHWETLQDVPATSANGNGMF